MRAPRTLEEYLDWAKVTLDSDFNNPTSQRVYEVNLTSYFIAVAEHRFFKGLQAEVEKWEEEYCNSTNSGLLMEKTPPILVQKPYLSAIDKSFRVNILWNENFPEHPEKGWVTTDNLYYYFNDLIRCCMVCKFIDGPRFITDKLMKYANELNLERRQYSQERDDGYYAYHYYVKLPVNLLNKDWKETSSLVEVEIQVTTQLQDILRSLTHNFYEKNRLLPGEDSSKWKWEFTSNRFRVGYLSHTLHLLESIVLESRNELKKQSDANKIKKE